MTSPRAAYENPYWFEYTKPHAFDPDEVEALCRIGFNTIQATRNLSVLWNSDELEGKESPHWEYPLLIDIHQRSAEIELSRILLKLAVAYRALDDQLKVYEPFVAFREKQLKAFGAFLTVYSEGEIRDCLRETCNKIIHAEDVRITYGHNDEEDEKRVWHMTNTVELQGRFRSEKWSVSFQVLDFFEAMLETVQFTLSN